MIAEVVWVVAVVVTRILKVRRGEERLSEKQSLVFSRLVVCCRCWDVAKADGSGQEVFFFLPLLPTFM